MKRYVISSNYAGSISEAEIRDLWKRKLRLFAKTAREKYLYQAEVLQELLVISDTEAEEVFSQIQSQL